MTTNYSPQLESKKNEDPAHTRVLTAASLRIPVTIANRDYLRRIRQAELLAWQNAPGGTRCARDRQ